MPLPAGRRRLIVGGVLAGAIVVGAVAGWNATGGYEGKYALPPAGAPLHAGPAGPVPPPVGRPAPVMVARPPAAPPAAVATAADDEDADRIAGAIARATRKALRRGEPVRWHKAGQTGYVTVSAPRDDGGRLCRNVSATIASETMAARSAAHLWCSDDGDEWEPAR